MPARTGEILKKIFLRDWVVKFLALIFALFLWFYVVVKTKVPFQTEVPIVNVPKGVEVFPKTVFVGGKISDKFYSESYLKCFKAYIEWDGRSKYATVRVEYPLPSVFVEIDSIYPQTVEIKRKTPQESGFSTTSPRGSTSSNTKP